MPKKGISERQPKNVPPWTRFTRLLKGYLTGSSQTSSFSPALSLRSVRDTSPSNWIGQPVLTHHCAECLRTCFTRWLGLACVITFEWGLGAGRLPCWSCVVFSKRELQARERLGFWKKRRNSFSAAPGKPIFSEIFQEKVKFLRTDGLFLRETRRDGI